MVISSSVVKYLLGKSPRECLLHHDQLIAAVSNRAPWRPHWESTQSRKEMRGWGVLLTCDCCSLIVAMLCQNILRCFWPMKSSLRRYLGFSVFFHLFLQKYDRPHFSGHRRNKILPPRSNYFCWVCNFKVTNGKKTSFPQGDQVVGRTW